MTEQFNIENLFGILVGYVGYVGHLTSLFCAFIYYISPHHNFYFLRFSITKYNNHKTA